MRAPNVGSNAVNVGARFKPAHVVKTKNTGSRSAEAVSLALELAVAALEPRNQHMAESLAEMAQPYTRLRAAQEAAAADPNLSDAGRTAAVRDALPDVMKLVSERRARVARMRGQAEAARWNAVAERTAILDARVKADPAAVERALDALVKVDPVVVRQRV